MQKHQRKGERIIMLPFTLVMLAVVLIAIGYNWRCLRRNLRKRDGSATLSVMYIVISAMFLVFAVTVQITTNHPGIGDDIVVKERYNGSTLYFDNESKEYFTVDNNLMSFDRPFIKELVSAEDAKDGSWREGIKH